MGWCLETGLSTSRSEEEDAPRDEFLVSSVFDHHPIASSTQLTQSGNHGPRHGHWARIQHTDFC